MRAAAYLALCAGAGALVGRGFGAFARAPFHFPLRRTDASPAHQALLEALDVVEFPALFGLTLACALVLWAWMERRRAGPRVAPRAALLLLALCAAPGAAITANAADRPGRLLAAAGGAALGALVGWMLLSFWRAAAGGGASIAARWASQLPLAAGHLAATAAASMSLGYRGESSLIHGIALLIGLGLFGVELVVASIVSAAFSPRRA
jgi:hypothetical protein